ncbi:thioesterase family protein [soil metagenome]
MMRHVYRCPVRWSDMDAFGHINNVRFLTFLEEARVDLLFTLGRQSGAGEMAEGVVVARHEIDYLKPLDWTPEGVDVVMWVSRIGAGSFDVSYDIRGGDVVYARARSVLVPFDLAAGRPRRLTAAERALLESYRGGS